MSSLVRTRWSAIGAAVAITLGAGGLGLAHATSPSGAAAFVPITPCRVFDTRPAFNVGPKSSPFGPGEIYTVDGSGTTGQCTLPTTATGLVLNMTAVGATAPTYLTVWGDGSRPNASSLNPTPGEPPTPNAVTTDLTAGGDFLVYNLAGSVHVFADVVGYYTDHTHDDRYYTKTEVRDLAVDGIIPSGMTVTGNFYWDGHGSTSTVSDGIGVELPGRAPVPLTDPQVNFDQPGTTGDGDPQCTGSATAPTAPAGKVCIYLYASNGMATNQLYGGAGVPLADAGFLVLWLPNGNDNVDQYVAASWAYTAP